MDFNSFFGWVGVGSLVLAIPLSIAANLLTPRIQIWWATTSHARRHRRIQYLTETIDLYSKDDPLILKFEFIAQGLHYAASGIIEFFGLVATAIALAIGQMTPPPTHTPDWARHVPYFVPYLLIGAVWFILTYINYRATNNVIKAAYYFRLASYRLTKVMVEKLQKELDKLVDNSAAPPLPKPQSVI